MEQEELEKRAKSLFTEQGLEIEDGETSFYVEEPELEFRVLSSEDFSAEEVQKAAEEFDKVFIDEGFEAEAENVSVIHEEREEEIETPSYEIIGDIAVISELPDMGENEAVQAIRKHHPHVETVLLKQEGLKGEFRVGDYEKLYGEDTETLHTEFGCDFKVDPTKAYYSERFSTERDRIVSQIEDGERVLIMFAGVGPFAIMAAENAKPSEVVGIEKNPVAAEYFRKNVELNDVEDTVEAIEGDVSEEVERLGRFDRIVMPLPGSADEFLETAFNHAEKGGVIHYYRFVEEDDWSGVLEEVENAANTAGRDYEVLERTVCGHRGPTVDRVCLDIKAS